LSSPNYRLPYECRNTPRLASGLSKERMNITHRIDIVTCAKQAAALHGNVARPDFVRTTSNDGTCVSKKRESVNLCSTVIHFRDLSLHDSN
jgi:hypothetical protein